MNSEIKLKGIDIIGIKLFIKKFEKMNH